ncbi:DEAD/DEAH box helicase [Frigidibacter albus]|uniref:DEAD/DEAH box helicase n=1 Tax=Frigidibacter albus TaxID=1465486 RepID=A0A6L8VF04_9RHOB|nr:DEAD/DEAH box helicase [Frigidibacter albus]NBE31005.1 DEAD/DEAH box helicase [Frigidibacter albus]
MSRQGSSGHVCPRPAALPRSLPGLTFAAPPPAHTTDKPLENFDNLGLSKQVLENLAAMGLTKPTPIQAEAIPYIVKGRDLLGLAQTGTGKTAAFGLPMVTRLIEYGKRPTPKSVRALILAPTRELATQISDNITAYADGTPIRVFRIVGGASINVQVEKLKRGVDVLIATPGRLMDLLDRGALTLADTKYLVLDEADQMLDIGFIHTLRQIARLLPRDRQTLLFSATMPKLMEELADSYLTDPVRVAVDPPGRAAEKITQGVHFTNQGDKAKLLADYVAKHPGELALVFGRTKHGSEKLMKLLDSWGFSVGAIHGNKSQGQRERTLAQFRAGEIKVLVATDVAARGLDIPDVRHVYNYDLPNVPENYVHRIGRTARAGKDGKAVAFCSPLEVGDLRAIEKAMKAPIPVIGGEVPVAQTPQPGARPQRKPGQKPSGAPKQGGYGKPMAADGARKRPAKRPSRRPRSEQAA